MVSRHPDPVFAVDHDDHASASDGRSRYGAYLRLHRRLFEDVDGTFVNDPAEFAAAAWRVACRPIMSPGYVYWHPRVQSAKAELDDVDNLAVVAVIALPLPSELCKLAVRWSGWTRLPGSELWREPVANDRRVALTTVTLRVPVRAHALPAPRYQDRAADVETAKRAVRALCEVASAELAATVAAVDELGQVRSR